MRFRSAFGVGLLTVACTGTIVAPPPQPPPEPPPPETCDVPAVLPGAPVPMRRLNRVHVEETVREVFGVTDSPSVSDERLFTYRSNISSPVDDTAVQGYFDFAERVAAQVPLTQCTRSGCLAWLLDDVGPRLFRRPLEGELRDRYTALFTRGVQASDAGVISGAQYVLEAMLQSPAFLYVDEPVNGEGRLDGYGVATRLALMFWGQNPDAALLAAAQRGDLDTEAGVRTQVRAMLADPRSAHGFEGFVTQWLELERLWQADARPDLVALGSPVLTALESEPVEVMRAAVLRGADLGELLTSSRTVTLPELQAHYGADIASTSGGETLLDPARRAGLFSLPGVMASMAHAGVTSPTVRGYTLLANVMCQPPSPPPAGVSVTLPPVTPGSTTRERLEQHFSDVSCASCHRAMDGMGFAFENYDPVGKWRDFDNGKPVDAHSEFTLAGKPISITGARELGEALAAQAAVRECFARQWTRYATGIPEPAAMRCYMKALGEQAAAPGSIESLIVALASSDYVRKGAAP